MARGWANIWSAVLAEVDPPAWGRRAGGVGLAGGAAVALAEKRTLYLIFCSFDLIWLAQMDPGSGSGMTEENASLG